MFEFFYGSKYKIPRTLKGIKKGQNGKFYNGDKNGVANREYSEYPIYSSNVITDASENNTLLGKYNSYHQYYKKANVTGSRKNTVNKNNISYLINNALSIQMNMYHIYKK